MQEQIELRDILFENVYSVMKLTPGQSQLQFIDFESVAETIAIAYAGINEGYPGFLQVVYYNGSPAGIILIGRSPVEEGEPEILQKYEYVYRIWLLFIDENYQRRGIGKAALNLALEKLEEYPNAEQSPIYLQCHKENVIALTLYESFGFQPIHGVTIDDNFVLIRFPGR